MQSHNFPAVDIVSTSVASSPPSRIFHSRKTDQAHVYYTHTTCGKLWNNESLAVTTHRMHRINRIKVYICIVAQYYVQKCAVSLKMRAWLEWQVKTFYCMCCALSVSDVEVVFFYEYFFVQFVQHSIYNWIKYILCLVRDWNGYLECVCVQHNEQLRMSL